jgi:hypothetical protein
MAAIKPDIQASKYSSFHVGYTNHAIAVGFAPLPWRFGFGLAHSGVPGLASPPLPPDGDISPKGATRSLERRLDGI